MRRFVARKNLVIIGMGLLLWHSSLNAQAPAAYVSTPNAALTQGTPVQNALMVTEVQSVADLKVTVNIVHSHSGDLTLRLRHADTGTTITLLQKLGSGLTFGCSANSLNVTFEDHAATSLDQFDCSGDPQRNAQGSYRPTNLFSAFVGQSMAGQWVLEVVDNTIGDNGTLQSWGISFNSGVSGSSTSGAGINDGRVNNRLVDLAAPVAIYCQDGFVKVYDIVNSIGALAFSVVAPEADRTLDKNIRLAEGLGNALYQLTTGELQVNAAGLLGEEGKEYVFLWQSCP